MPAPLAGADSPGEIVSADYGLDELSCRVRMARAAVLVLADMGYPGWQVTVDGQQRPLLVADGFFRAVALGEGEHLVCFHFAPRGMKVLALLRWIGFLLMGLLLAAGAWRAWAAGIRSDGGTRAADTNGVSPPEVTG